MPDVPAPAAPPRGGRTTVRRILTRLILANLAVLMLMATLGLVASWHGVRSVDYLTSGVEPARRSSAATMQDITDAETYLRGWSLSGRRELLQSYENAVADYGIDQLRLRERARIDSQLATLVEAQDEAARAWVEGYGVRRSQAPGGAAAFDEELFDRGYLLFQEVRRANVQVIDRLSLLTREARDRADERLRAAYVLIGLVSLAGVALALVIAARARRAVNDPLVALEHTVARLAAGELSARADLAGPREVSRVAQALNSLAEENERARGVEARIVDQLRALDSVKSDFVSNVSHELRTPLTSIGGYVELLQEELGDRMTEDELDMLVAARRNVTRLRELIEDLLALTRAESRGTDLEQVDLVPMLREVATDMSMSASQRGVRLELSLPDGPVAVLADLSQLSRAVTNLIANAVKYSHGEPVVEIALAVVGPEAEISIRDHGIGIPAAEMEELGSRFYRASNAVRLGISGTGLGLRIVQAILENHHGTLEIESEQGVGTTARMRIPLRASLHPSDERESDSSRGG